MSVVDAHGLHFESPSLTLGFMSFLLFFELGGSFPFLLHVLPFTQCTLDTQCGDTNAGCVL